MKQLYYGVFFLILAAISPGRLWGQLADGSVAPDFTLTDINGQTHNLYSYLNQGKTVFLDFFATWCGPCWNYHNSGALEGLYEAYGPNGTGEVMVIAIEGDGNTTLADLYGTGSNTQGNWVAGTAYPIINSASLNGAYNIAYFPTIYGICPNRAITEVGQISTDQLYDFVGQCPSMTPGFSDWEITPVACVGGQDGAISIASAGGVIPLTYRWSNNQNGTMASGLAAGSYRCTITDALGQTAVSPWINVPQPAAPLNVAVDEIENEGCLGQPGSITLNVTGGWDGYEYDWNTGATSPFIALAQEGMYSVTVTDERGCTATLGGIEVLPPPTPDVIALAPSGITCVAPTVQLSGLGSSEGSQYAYAWTTANGHIVSGANTLLPVVNAAGVYTLQVVHLPSGCSASDEVTVSANTATPSAAATLTGGINCVSDQATLQASAGGMTYSWSTANGQISGPANQAQLVVSMPGVYTLAVQNPANGCSAQQSYTIAVDTLPPALAPLPAAITCAQAAVVLNTGFADAQASFAWSGPGGFTSALAQPSVGVVGLYSVAVTGGNGCEALGSVSVGYDTLPPQLSALGGVLNCWVDTLALQASSTTSGAQLWWTNAAGDTLTPALATASGAYTAHALGANGCIELQTVQVQQNTTLPMLAASPDLALPCNNDIAMLTANIAGDSLATFVWSAAGSGSIIAGVANDTATVQGPGQYALLAISGINGCAAADTVVVTQPQALSLAVALEPVSCFGLSDGAAAADAGNGIAPYNYVWSTGDTTAMVAGLPAGSYTLTITDSGECLRVDTVVVNQPAALALSIFATHQSAFGADDGSLTANISGGTGAYALLWSTGDTSAALSGLAPGAYALSVTDANGCTSVQAATVNSFNCTAAAAPQVTHVSCFGAADGSISLQFSGGSEPFSVSWLDGSTDTERSGLAAGQYSAVVTDGANCPLALSVTVQQPAPLLANASAAAETSYQANNGVLAANPAGGAAPYTFAWSTGDTTPQVSPVAPGVYGLTITDANGCSIMRSLTVEAFVCFFSVNAAVTDVKCNGENTGQIAISPLAGEGPYVYQWSNGATGNTQSNLAAGDYTIVATDGNNCPATLSLTIEQPELLAAGLEQSVGVACAEDPAGSALVAVAGGVTPYTYAWSDGQSEALAEGLVSGVYSCLVSDANGCTQAVEGVVIEANDAEAPQAVAQSFVLGLGANGSASLQPANVDGGSIDNCGIAVYALSRTDFNCDDLGEQWVTLFVADGAGNVDSAQARIEVVDNLAPGIAAEPVTVFLDENGQAVLPLGHVSVTDNCDGDISLDADITQFSCDNLGANAVVLSATDAHGNTATYTWAVVVRDAIAPVVQCPAPVGTVSCAGVATFAWPTVADNCGADGLPQQIEGLPSGSVYPPGITVNTFRYTDASGNAGQCSFTVEAPQPMSLTLTAEGASCPGAADGAASVAANGGVPGYTYLWSNSGNTATVTNLPAGTYEVLVSDARGCQRFGEISVEEPPAFAMTVVGVEPDVNSSQTGAIDITFSGGTPPYVYAWLLNGAEVSSEEDPSGLAGGWYVLRLTDSNGCQFISAPVRVETLTGIHEAGFVAGLRVYPNPATTYLVFEFGAGLDADCQLGLYDALGRLVAPLVQVPLGSSQVRLSTADLPPGLYWAKLRQGAVQWAGKIVITR